MVGVTPGQPASVVEQAARCAQAFGSELICAHVRGPASASEPTDDELVTHLAQTLVEDGVTWSTRVLTGDIAVALGQFANSVDAAMIVVGTHERIFSTSVQEFFHRSIAVQLAHRQQRPVLVVPARVPSMPSSSHLAS